MSIDNACCTCVGCEGEGNRTPHNNQTSTKCTQDNYIGDIGDNNASIHPLSFCTSCVAVMQHHEECWLPLLLHLNTDPVVATRRQPVCHLLDARYRGQRRPAVQEGD